MEVLESDVQPQPEVLSALQTLLELHPAEVDAERVLIVTVEPAGWKVRGTGEERLIVDLSSMLDLRPRAPSIDTLTAAVVERLAAQGWPREWLVRHQRSSLSSRVEIDLAVVHPSQGMLVAFEIRPSSLLFPHSIRQRQDQLAARAEARWVCVTDSERFHCLDLETGARKTFEDGLRPADLGIEVSAVSIDGRKEDLLAPAPATAVELTRLVEEFRPGHILLDASVPRALTFTPAQLLRDPSSALRRLLPDDVRDLPNEQIELQEALLVWASHLPSVEAISAVVSSSLTSGVPGHWAREYVARRLSTCAVVQIAPAVLGNRFSSGANVLYEGGTRSAPFQTRLTSSGDLIGLTERTWFTDLTAWMRGTVGEEPESTQSDEEEVTPLQPEPAGSDEDAGGTQPDEPKAETGSGATSTGQQSEPPKSPGPGNKVDVHLPEDVKEIRQRLERLGDKASLGELCDIAVGRLLPLAEKTGALTIRLAQPQCVRGRYLDLQSAGEVERETVTPEMQIYPDDLLLPLTASDQFGVAQYSSREPAALGEDMARIRLDDDRVTLQYLLEYLNSPAAQKLLLAQLNAVNGREHSEVSLGILQSLPVPVVPAERTEGLNQIEHIEAILRAKAEEIGSLRRGLFDKKNRNEFGKSLDELRTRTRVLSISLQSLESLDYQIAVTYPYPIAFRYRLLQGVHEPDKVLDAQFILLESMLAFLASLSVAILDPDDRKSVIVNPELPFAAVWKRPMAIGVWRDIIIAASKVYRAYQGHPLARSLANLHIEHMGPETFGGAIEQLVAMRNSLAHYHEPDVDKAAAARSLQPAIDLCMRSLSFLADFPLRCIEDEAQQRDGSWVLQCLTFRGDHLGRIRERIHFDTAPPRGKKSEDLFLDLGDGKWINLFPFLTTFRCKQCKSWETYRIALWNPLGRNVKLRSLERHHEYEGEAIEAIARGLAEWHKTAYEPPAAAKNTSE